MGLVKYVYLDYHVVSSEWRTLNDQSNSHPLVRNLPTLLDLHGHFWQARPASTKLSHLPTILSLSIVRGMSYNFMFDESANESTQPFSTYSELSRRLLWPTEFMERHSWNHLSVGRLVFHECYITHYSWLLYHDIASYKFWNSRNTLEISEFISSK